MSEKNYYEILGISQNASEKDIKDAYRKLAQKHHPDINKLEESEEIFKEINRAYDTLSDSLKRADYDQEFNEGYVKTAKEETEPKAKEEAKPTFGMFAAAFSRMFFVLLIGIVVGGLIEFIIWSFTKKPAFSFTLFYPAMFWGGLAGILLGADLNFRVESFLGPGYLSRTYSFLRTFLYALSFCYFFGRVFSYAAVITNYGWLQITGATTGLLIGATFGSDAEGFNKLKDKEGRFNLLYTGLRAIEVGLVGLFIGAIFGFVVQYAVPLYVIFWSAYFGFSLGIIVGAISPSNLAAYSSYASAAVKNVIVILMIAGGVLLGIIFSYIFHDQLQEFLRIFVK